MRALVLLLVAPLLAGCVGAPGASLAQDEPDPDAAQAAAFPGGFVGHGISLSSTRDVRGAVHVEAEGRFELAEDALVRIFLVLDDEPCDATARTWTQEPFVQIQGVEVASRDGRAEFALDADLPERLSRSPLLLRQTAPVSAWVYAERDGVAWAPTCSAV